jgi:hypothetical protein
MIKIIIAFAFNDSFNHVGFIVTHFQQKTSKGWCTAINWDEDS